MTALEFPLGLLRAIVVAFGLIWGSFLNVVIYRLPLDLSVVFPPSHCPGCGAPVRAYDNIPVLSFLVLRGRARCCGMRLSARYPVVEALGGALSFAVFEVLVRNEPVLGRALAIYGADLAFCLGLVAAAFIDAEHMYLPDSITIGGVVLGLGTCSLRGMGFYEALLGTVAGFVGVWLPFIVMYRWVRGVPGMGLGDAKLVALAGAWFGVLGAVVVLFAGAVQGTLAALVLYATRGNLEEPKAVREDREALERAAALGDDDARKALADDPLGTAPEPGLLRARLPFGPFLVLACLEFLFLGAWFRGRYFGLFF